MQTCKRLALALALLITACWVLGTRAAVPGIAHHEPVDTRVTYDRIMQTCTSPEAVPKYIAQQFDRYAPGCRRVVLSDAECVEFLRSEFGEDHVRQFYNLRVGAHKADLMRYAWLYKHGGVYMDIKTVLTRPIAELFPDKDVCYVVVTEGTAAMFNGIIATPPRNPMILHMLNGAMRMTNDQHYLAIVQDSYEVLTRHLGEPPVASGLYRCVTDAPDVYVYLESMRPARECDFELDVRSVCAMAMDGEHVMAKIRDPRYPWPTTSRARAVSEVIMRIQRGLLRLLDSVGLGGPNATQAAGSLFVSFRPAP
jgi:hypothetical protein